MGLLHGGASVVLAETLGSMAATCCVDFEKQHCVGLEINANHLRAVRQGTITGTARPLHVGRRDAVDGDDPPGRGFHRRERPRLFHQPLREELPRLSAMVDKVVMRHGVTTLGAYAGVLALRDKGSKNLTLVCNSLGGPNEIRGQILAENKQVKKLVAAFSVRPGLPTASEEQIDSARSSCTLSPRLLKIPTARSRFGLPE